MYKYPGQQKMLELIKKHYWWPEIQNNIKKYVQKYQKCQQNKVQYMKKIRELYLLEIFYYGRKLVSRLLDYYQDQRTKMEQQLQQINLQR